MSKVISLFGNGAPVAPPQEPTPEPEEIRQESHTEPQPEKPKVPVYVRIQADMFHEMLTTLSFYARYGWDDGKKAREIMEEVMKPEPPAA